MDRLIALQTFVRLVERKSFTAVGDELRVKQSTISKWLASLEDDLGVRLFDRTTRSLRMTETGRTFYDHAIRVLDAYEQAVASAQQAVPVISGRIRMSLPVVFGTRFVVPNVAKFARRHEALHVEMVFSDRYVRLVEEGFDMAVRVGTQIDSTLRSHYLGSSPRRLVASPGYIKKHGAPSDVRELSRHSCLVHTESGSQTWRFRRSGERTSQEKWKQVSVAGRISANHSEATLSMAKSGMGICLLASWLVDKDVEAGRLVRLLPDYEAPEASIRALTPPGKHILPRVRAVIELLRAELAKTLS